MSVIEHRVAWPPSARLARRGRWGWNARDLAGGGVPTRDVAEVDLDAVEQVDREAFLAGVNGLHAAVLHQALQQADDAVRAAEQVLRHAVVSEHAGLSFEEPQLDFEAGEVSDPRRDAGGGVVPEGVEVDQIEATLGLGGGLIALAVRRRGDDRVVAAFPEESRSGDVDPDQDQGDVHAHERPEGRARPGRPRGASSSG